MRPYPLSELKTGMTRLRTKGGANPKALYTLKNGHLNAAGAPESRDGLRVDHVLPPGTKGLMSFEGKKLVFGTVMQDLGSDEYELGILVHPEDASLELLDIHFAEAHMGAPYVVAEFTNGDVYHYWLSPGTEWAADTVHRLGDIIEPTVPNGLVYRATRLLPPFPVWAPDVERTVGDRIEPTTPNNFYLEAVDVSDGGRSGSSEPVWPEKDGARVTEYAGQDPVVPPTPPETGGGGTTLPTDTLDRYTDARDEQ